MSYTIEKGKQTYQCTHPNKILEEIEQKENALKQLKDEVPNIKDLFISLSQISEQKCIGGMRG